MSYGYHIPVPSYFHGKWTDKTAEKLQAQNPKQEKEKIK